MEKYGYKAFDKGLVNRYGTGFEVGKTYSINSETVKWGNDGKGFHFCKNLEDTLRYFDAMNEEVDICYVKGFGNIMDYEDDYNEYYNMYVSSNIEIIRILTREEIINHMLGQWEVPMQRFVQGYKLNESEIDMFLEKEPKLLSYIEYYQKDNKGAFKR